MKKKEFRLHGFKISIIQRPAFKVAGYTRPVNLDGNSIALFIKELAESRQMSKLAATLQSPQQIWVCLSDVNCSGSKRFCAVCDQSCSGFHTRCTVCVEKTEQHDFSQFNDNELFSFSVPASEWAEFEVGEDHATGELYRFDAYKVVGEIGYQWDDKIRLHFDNEHEWEPGKAMTLLLPVKRKLLKRR